MTFVPRLVSGSNLHRWAENVLRAARDKKTKRNWRGLRQVQHCVHTEMGPAPRDMPRRATDVPILYVGLTVKVLGARYMSRRGNGDGCGAVEDVQPISPRSSASDAEVEAIFSLPRPNVVGTSNGASV